MKYSYNWLKKLTGTKKSAEKIAELLTMHSFELEDVQEAGSEFKGVVVGEILDIKKHPNANKLSLTLVNVGNKKLSIICGAKNIKVGDKVPVALVGTELPNGMVIREVKIRGVESSGMLAAEDELGLGKDHSGILILDTKAKIGEPLARHLGLDDTLIEVDVLSNRGHDALSHVGMARELCALEGKKIKYDYEKLNLPAKKSKKIKVSIKDKKLCPRYIGAVVENIEIKESPVWLKSLLRNYGINPINNIVDATNYVMLELGQPLHAFDFDKIKNGSKAGIVIRAAKKGEKLKLLDETEVELDSNDIVIADEKKPIALAGIMGGLESGISEKTTNIVLEAANFNPRSIRKSRMRLGLKTDASDHFEKEIDPNLAEKAMVRLIEVITETSGKLEGMEDLYPLKVDEWKVKLDLDYLNGLMGEKIPAKKAESILNSLEIQTSFSGKKITATIPTFRIDLKTPEDLIEEIGRIYGYDKVESVPPLAEVQPVKINERRVFDRLVKEILAGDGFDEVYNYSFYSKHDAGLLELGAIKHLELENPMNPDQEWLRVSLIPNILKNVRENLKRFSDFRIFEIGKVFHPNGKVLPVEKRFLVGAVVLNTKSRKKSGSFFDAKGSIDTLLSKLRIQDYYFDVFDSTPKDTLVTMWHEGRSAEIKTSTGKSIGYIGELNPLILTDFDIHKRVTIFEIEMAKLREFSQDEREYSPISKYPTTMRDVSMIANDNIRVADVLMQIQKSGGDLVQDVDLFDIFEFEERGEVSYAFHIVFGSKDKTLKNKDVDKLMDKINSDLEKELLVKIRN